MSSLLPQSKNKKRSSSTMPQNKDSQYKMPTKKRNMSTVATHIDSTAMIPHQACCKKPAKSSSKLCKDCLSFILTNVDLKENTKKTARKSCTSAKKSSKGTAEPKT